MVLENKISHNTYHISFLILYYVVTVSNPHFDFQHVTLPYKLLLLLLLSLLLYETYSTVG